ncbi:hypothetical protein Hanom_Chr03g00200811 [Helianthus anomalus]
MGSSRNIAIDSLAVVSQLIGTMLRDELDPNTQEYGYNILCWSHSNCIQNAIELGTCCLIKPDVYPLSSAYCQCISKHHVCLLMDVNFENHQKQLWLRENLKMQLPMEQSYYFYKPKSANGNGSEPILNMHNLNGVDTDHASRPAEFGQSSQITMAPQVYHSLVFPSDNSICIYIK